MTNVLADYHVHGAEAYCDPGRQKVGLVVWPFTFVLNGDEARHLHDKLGAALAGLAVKGAEAVEVDRG